jgi:hypothetical protein
VWRSAGAAQTDSVPVANPVAIADQIANATMPPTARPRPRSPVRRIRTNATMPRTSPTIDRQPTSPVASKAIFERHAIRPVSCDAHRPDHALEFDR